MTLTARDRRALIGLAIAALVILLLRFAGGGSRDPKIVSAINSIPLAEKRLARLRQLAATVPGKQAALKQISGDLAVREKGILAAETASQAQAQLLQTVTRSAKNEGIDVRGKEIGQVKPLGDDYGEAFVNVSFECGIDQLVNFLASLTREPQLLATHEVRIMSGNAKEKTVRVQLGLSAVIPRALAPAKKGAFSF